MGPWTPQKKNDQNIWEAETAENSTCWKLLWSSHKYARLELQYVWTSDNTMILVPSKVELKMEEIYNSGIGIESCFNCLKNKEL